MGSWYSLLEISREARTEAEYWRAARPLACPLCGEPLIEDTAGVLHCRFDGWVDDGNTHP